MKKHPHPLHRHINLHPVISILSLTLVIVIMYVAYLAIDEQNYNVETKTVRHVLSEAKAMENFANIQASLEGVLGELRDKK